MKKIVTFAFTLMLSLSAFSQVSDKQINALVTSLKSDLKSEEQIKEIVNGIITDPELYNSYWKNFLDQAFKEDGKSKWKLLRDLNLQFKTFQTEGNPATTLGFAYDFNYDYGNFKEKDAARTSTAFGFSAKGNVAFKKVLNPNDFLETKLKFSYSRFSGGVIKQNDSTVFSRLNKIEDELVNEKDVQSKKAIALWEAFGKDLQLSNQFYYAISPKFALESNQDFSKKQFTSGLSVDLGTKAWKANNTLSFFNVFDYPFALLRLLTGTDREFTVYGSTIPTVQLVYDYVVPTADLERESLLGNKDVFPRFKFETSFRTFITRVNKENIFFNANYRYYKELSAPQEIKYAELDSRVYYVMALQSTSGLYFSYAKGTLPFDAKNDAVYAIGFSYKFD